MEPFEVAAEQVEDVDVDVTEILEKNSYKKNKNWKRIL